MRRRLRMFVRWLPGFAGLAFLVAPHMGLPPYDFDVSHWSLDLDRPSVWVIGGMYVAVAIALAMVLPGFLRLRSLSRHAKGRVLVYPLVFAGFVAIFLEPAAGAWVALGLTAQLAAAITWSERCHALLGGGKARRIAWAIVGVLVPPAILVAPVATSATYVFQRYVPPAPVTGVVLAGASVLVLLLAAIHHLRARNRALEWRLARETGEYPSLPQPTVTPPPSSKAS